MTHYRIGRTTRLFPLGAFLLAALLFASPAAAQQTAEAASAPPAGSLTAEKIKAKGLPNLGRVNGNLYRGGQPEDKHEAFEKLRELGIDIIVNLRDDDDDIEEEQRRIEALGMQFISIPWSGYNYPDNAQVAAFLRIVRDNPDKQIFVHCRRGAERTGVMLAAYRMSVEGWTPEQALREMNEFRFRGFWFRNLRRYVEKFPEYWETDPVFAPLRASAAPPPQ
jgi:tyrosine-protein phosphatase SIW14